MSVVNVGKPLVRSQALQLIKELIQEKNRMNAVNVKKPSPRSHS
jgi:hypothetical protein